MGRRSFLSFVFLLLASAVVAEAPARPDVLLIAVDGLGTTASPAVAALGRRARVFESAYLPHPLAGATRAALFFGRRPERAAIWGALERLPPETVALPAAFARAGYQTARVGTALGSVIEAEVAWDRVVAPDAAADTARRVLDLLDAPRERPLFVAASFEDVGAVVSVVGEVKGAPAGPERPVIAMDDLPFLSRPGRVQSPPAVPEDVRRHAERVQRERTERFDAQLARVVAWLDRAQRWDRTIVALVGTQTPYLGAQGLSARADLLFESTLRVPLVVAAPGLVRAGSTRALADVTDVYVTLLDLAGLPAVVEADGRSLAPVVRDADAVVREEAISVVRRQTGQMGRTVRTRARRFTEWPDGSLELYDHEADPHEHTNLARRPEHQVAVAEMRALLEKRPPASIVEKRAKVPASRAPRPNVLLILLDDASMHLGTYGYPVKTPNVDRLAARGRRFDRAYAQVSMCSPSRTSLLSGWQPDRTGVWDNVTRPRRPGLLPIEDHFRANGYWTAAIGKVWETRFAKDFKWDLAEYVPAVAASKPAASEDEGKDEPAPRNERIGRYYSFWKKSDAAEEELPDGQRARRVAQLVGETRDRPFFIALGFGKPHLRWVAPRRYFDLYDPSTIALPPNPADDSDDIPEQAIRDDVFRPGRFFVGRQDEATALDKQEAIAAYYATVSFVDAQIGVVLDALDREKRWDDTIVVLASDNGFHLAEHRGDMWRKDTLFEEGVRVPLIVAAPGLGQPGVASSSLAELLDLYPTLIELAGVPRAPGLDGRSLAPILRDPTAEVHQAAYSWRRVGGPIVSASIRSGKWRYTQWSDGSEELFDLEADPLGRHNLAGRAEHAEVQADMRRRSEEKVIP
jgi:uncharacterized sulfatase